MKKLLAILLVPARFSQMLARSPLKNFQHYLKTTTNTKENLYNGWFEGTMKTLTIALSVIFVSLITATVFANQPHHKKLAMKSPRGFYMANFSSSHDMDITYEHCTSGKCALEDIKLPRVGHGKNMQWVSGADHIFSVTEIDEAGNAGNQIILNGCSTQSTEYTFTNMVALIDIPGTKMIGCIPMLTHDPSMPLGQ